MRELITHLDSECSGKGKSSSIKRESSDDVEESLDKSILAKALMQTQAGDEEAAKEDEAQEEVEEEEDEVETDAVSEEDVGKQVDMQLFECSTCKMQFTSVNEHVKEFHADTEVVFKVSGFVQSKLTNFWDLTYTGVCLY